MKFKEKDKKALIIGISSILIIIVLAIFINFNKSVKVTINDNGIPEIIAENDATNNLNQYFVNLQKSFENTNADIEYTVYENDTIAAILIKINSVMEYGDEKNTSYESYIIEKSSGEVMSNKNIVKLFNTEISDIEKLVNERFEGFFEEELQGKHIIVNDYDYYLENYRNISDISNSYVLFVNNDKLFVYLNFRNDNEIGDKDYFDQLDYNPYIIEVN